MAEKQPNTLFCSLGDLKFELQAGIIAQQADASILLRAGDTMLLATVCVHPEAEEGTDFTALRVEYQERRSSYGRTVGGILKREGRASDREILVSRLIDRTLRPLIAPFFYNEIQVIVSLVSYDKEHSPDVMAVCAASAALALSSVPTLNVAGAVRIGVIDGLVRINPSLKEMAESSLELTLAGSGEHLTMIEGEAKFVLEETLMEALDLVEPNLTYFCDQLQSWAKKVGRKKLEQPATNLAPLEEAILTQFKSPLQVALRIEEKLAREAALTSCRKTIKIWSATDSTAYTSMQIDAAITKVEARLMVEMIRHEHRRCDGRRIDQLRNLELEMGFLPRAHGSVLLTRGQTQAIVSTTLGNSNDSLRSDGLEGEERASFYLQYFFPPFCTGETGRVGGAGRREIGHGKLAEKALRPAIPATTLFPYVQRVESITLSSDGSSSMAATCGATMALIDAGVPIKTMIAGVAMGAVRDLESDELIILSDILGIEDALGQIDCKVTGDSEGKVTAIQMDVKGKGITVEETKRVIMQARQGRNTFLRQMQQAAPITKKELSAHAPRIEVVQIKPSKIGLLIGSAGKTIRGLMEATGTQIDVAEDGTVHITANNKTATDLAKQKILDLVLELEMNKIYPSEVISISKFGVVVKIGSQTGFCHISELSHERINDIDAFVQVGDAMDVRVIEIPYSGQMRVSRKAAL